jgi:transcriptional regulator with XRE-family HTH domain
MVTYASESTTALRTARLKARLSLREVSRAARVDPGHLSRVEAGRSCLSLAALVRVLDAIGLPDDAEALKPYAARRRGRSGDV